MECRADGCRAAFFVATDPQFVRVRREVPRNGWAATTVL